MHDSIDKQAKGIAGRGVLLDIAGMLGAEWLEQGFVITPDHLDQVQRLSETPRAAR